MRHYPKIVSRITTNLFAVMRPEHLFLIRNHERFFSDDKLYESWTPWSNCSNTCEGMTQRTRECKFENCTGLLNATKNCNTKLCDG